MNITIANGINTVVNSILTKLFIAVIIILCGLVLGRILGKLITKVLNEFELNRIMRKATGIKINLEEVTGTALSYFIYFIAIIMALETINIAPMILYILSSGVIIIIIISISLTVKDFFPNVMSSIIIHQKGFIKEGDRIKIEDIEGEIIKINLLETTVRSDNGDEIFIPNGLITRKKVRRFKRKR
ncbi:mechanosensitive ion channel family protein [Candidatus Woesearchaeota archaeon]|nr:mechanosensitive ion channel family protein [Candidatus Woesearchaeota archaeon]